MNLPPFLDNVQVAFMTGDEMRYPYFFFIIHRFNILCNHNDPCMKQARHAEGSPRNNCNGLLTGALAVAWTLLGPRWQVLSVNKNQGGDCPTLVHDRFGAAGIPARSKDYSAALATSTTRAKAPGSRTARSAKILRSRVMSDCRSACIKRL